MEPRKEEAGSIIYAELEEICEIIFHELGEIDIGFTINHQDKMVIRMKKGTILGAYNCTYNKKTMFLYKCKTDIEGYMLRKQVWLEILEDNKIICETLKENIKKYYFTTIKYKVSSEKRNYINKLKKRVGFNQIMSVVDLEK